MREFLVSEVYCFAHSDRHSEQHDQKGLLGMITTKIHEAIEASGIECRPFFEEASGLPHYLIDKSLIDLARSNLKGLLSGLFHMLEADHLLPFPKVLLEVETSVFGAFPDAPAKIVPLRTFVIAETADDGGVNTQRGYLLQRTTSVSPRGYLYFRVRQGRMTSGFRLHDGRTEVTNVMRKELNQQTWMLLALVAGTHVRGAVQELNPAPVRLNKARAAKGRSPIPEFTVLRIGHAYDRDGNKVSIPTGRTMPVHLRAGHTRGQHYGKGNALIKTVYIPPTIVNFDPSVEVKMPKRILAA